MKRVVDFRCEEFMRRALAESANSATLVRPQPPESRTTGVERIASSCRVLVVAEVRAGRLDMATARTITCGRRVSHQLEVVLFANHAEPLAAVASKLEGVARVLLEPKAADPDSLAERTAALIRQQGSSHVFAPGSTFGEQLIVRLAEHFAVRPILGVMGVVTATTFTRARTRATIATIETGQWPVLATVRLGAFHATGLPRQRRAREPRP